MSSAANRPPFLGLPYQDVPVFICNYNRLSCLLLLIEWLRRAGHKRIYVVDNLSTYPPLLSYYETARDVTVVRLKENLGHLSLWQSRLLEYLQVDTEYVYTDSDVVPSPCCPLDAVAHLQKVLNADPRILKAGLGLRIDNLPETYPHRAKVLAWEERLWRRPIAPGIMQAPVDTTFALYRPNSGHALSYAENVRGSYPLLSDHLGWHTDPNSPTEEDTFYARNARADVTSWSQNEVRPHLQASIDRHLLQAPTVPKLLHLNGGKDILPGWIHFDRAPKAPEASPIDPDCPEKALARFADGTLGGIYDQGLLGEARSPGLLMEALHRIVLPGARLVTRLSGPGAFPFLKTTGELLQTGSSFSGWEATRVTLVVRPGSAAMANEILAAAFTERPELFPHRERIAEVVVHFRRPAPASPKTSPTLVLQESPLDLDIRFLEETWG